MNINQYCVYGKDFYKKYVEIIMKENGFYLIPSNELHETEGFFVKTQNSKIRVPDVLLKTYDIKGFLSPDDNEQYFYNHKKISENIPQVKASYADTSIKIELEDYDYISNFDAKADIYSFLRRYIASRNKMLLKAVEKSFKVSLVMGTESFIKIDTEAEDDLPTYEENCDFFGKSLTTFVGKQLEFNILDVFKVPKVFKKHLKKDAQDKLVFLESKDGSSFLITFESERCDVDNQEISNLEHIGTFETVCEECFDMNNVQDAFAVIEALAASMELVSQERDLLKKQVEILSKNSKSAKVSQRVAEIDLALDEIRKLYI